MKSLELYAKSLFLFLFLDIKMLFDKDKIQKINLFENLTHTKVKDFLENDKLIFIVQNGELRKALFEKGKNIKRLQDMMHKRIKVVEFNSDPIKFITNFIYPITVESINLNDDTIEIKAEDRKTKGLLIGRERKNLNELSNLVKNYFSLQVKIL